MKATLIRAIFILCMYILTLSCASCEEEEIIWKARECISQEYDIPMEIAEQMNISMRYFPEFETWEGAFSFFRFSQNEFYFITDTDGVFDIYTNYRTPEDIQEGIDYFRAVHPSALALDEWEEQYGPYYLWNAEENGYFFSIYHHVPAETEFMYTLVRDGLTHYDLPSSNDISLDEAQEKASAILLGHFQGDEQKLESYQTGSWFYQDEDPKISRYAFYYYAQDTEDDPLPEYRVFIISADGSCFNAFEGEEPFYSDLYIKQPDGTYQRKDDPDAANSGEQETKSADNEKVDPDTILYYNPNGGFYYHADPNCKRISSQYTPLSGTFLYSQVNEDPYASLTPCRVCEAPER